MKQLTAEQRNVYVKRYKELSDMTSNLYQVLEIQWKWLRHYTLSDGDAESISETFDSLEEWSNKLHKEKDETLKIINGEK